jgi:excinuclease ABC subunit A
VRTTIAVQGARVHNLRNVSLEIPRDQLVVFTGVSGSGKSSLAFDTIYAEGQRRYLESLSSFARTFVDQVEKPDVDFVHGLSPVVSIGQKTVSRNPRSTVGTMTDIAGYVNLLFATLGRGHCPYCGAEVPVRSRPQILEQLLSLPAGTQVELRAPAFEVYGEDRGFLLASIRKRGVRRVVVDGEATVDITEETELEEGPHRFEAVVDRLVVRPGEERQFAASIDDALALGERFIGVRILECPAGDAAARAFEGAFGGCVHGLAMGNLSADQFGFNNPESACQTCLGLGTHLQVHPDLLVPDRRRSIAGGAFVPEAFRWNPETWDGRIMWSLARHYGFSLDTPFGELEPRVVDILFRGTRGDRFPLEVPPGVAADRPGSQEFRFDGIMTRIERQYRRYRQQQVAHSHMESYLEKVMVEHRCPDCGGARVRRQRLLVTLEGRDIHAVGDLYLPDLRDFLRALPLEGPRRHAARQILEEITARLELLLGIGLDYLTLNRRSATLSGGEAQRIRLSSQIGSGLMGMLYVLDEPSIGLHPKDNAKMIATLRRLRDIGNTVIVVEHDEDTISAADHVVELGPGAGVHGGRVVAQGTLGEILENEASPTGRFLSGRESIPLPSRRRDGPTPALVIRGARENNLRDLDVVVPLGRLVCVTGASGSGKSTLVTDILYRRLYQHFQDSRVLPGAHDAVEGIEHLRAVVGIDQSPLGRTSRSNPATYTGFYDDIRRLFAETPEARARDYTPARFSFNVKGGRCEECQGEGTVTTHLSFMPDVEVRCEACQGARYNAATLDVTYNGKTIAEVLDLSIEDGRAFFADRPAIARRLALLDDLGLGYLTLGQSATTLSGGEAQRVKLAFELSKLKRGGGTLYVLDEPTTGLHFADVRRLLDCLNRLVDSGHTVVVIEHHMDVIKSADHVIDLGPEGGHAGGLVVVAGTPEEVAAHPDSHTGRFLRPHLRAREGFGRGAPPRAPAGVR